MTVPEAVCLEAQKLVAHRTGLSCPAVRQEEFQQALARILSAESNQVSEAGLGRLAQLPDTAEEWRDLINVLTVGETYFFRDPYCLDALEKYVLPALISDDRAMPDRCVRVWSAGCSTGEEPYTVAILLDTLMPDRSKYFPSIVATDLNQKALSHARRGRFRSWALRETPTWVQTKYFRPTGRDEYELAPAIREMVTFRKVNLNDTHYPSVRSGLANFDLILCRNVLMYFTPEAQRQTADRLCRTLSREGWLVVSPAEASRDLFQKLTPINYPGVIVFRNGVSSEKKDGNALATGSSGPAFTAAHLRYDIDPIVPVPVPDVPGSAKASFAIREQAAESLDAIERLADQGQLAEARRLCEKAIRDDRLNLDVYLLMGSICQEAGHVNAAIEAFRHALYLCPDLPVPHFMIGNLLVRRGDKVRGKKHLVAAERLLQRLPTNHSVRGAANLTVGRLMEAIENILRGAWERRGKTH